MQSPDKIQGLSLKQGWPDDMEEATAFLNRNLQFDQLTSSLLYEKLQGDPDADPALCLGLYENKLLRGLLFALVRNIRGELYGYIKLLAVEESLRRLGLGTRLYSMAEEALWQKGVTRIRIMDVPLNYLMPGLDPRYTEAFCFFSRMGFHRWEQSLNMIVNLANQNWDTGFDEQRLQGLGLEIRRATPGDRENLHHFLEAEWALWKHECDMAMANEPISLHLALKNDKIMAFSAHEANNKGTGWFGPMGTDPLLRGMGVGQLLLKRCLHDMQCLGFRRAIIPWVAPVAFYSHHVGARIDRLFWRLEKMRPT